MLASPTPRRAPVAVITAAALVLGACGSSDSADPVSADVVEANAAATADVTAPSTDATPADVVPETVPVGTEPAPVVTEPIVDIDASCLVGSWVVTQEEMSGYFDALSSGLVDTGPSVEFDVGGEALLTFTDTDYVYTADFDLGLVAGEITGTGVSSGAVTGSWEMAGDRVVTAVGDSDLSVLVTVAGAVFDGGDFTDGLLNAAPISDAPLDCEGPTLGFQVDATGAVRHQVTLTPA